MKRTVVSLQRRHLIIAGLAGAAAPAVLFAASDPDCSSSVAARAAPRSGEPLLVSGRVVTASGKPLQGATIATAHGGRSRAMTDADGRFMLASSTPRAGKLAYRVTHEAQGVHEGYVHIAAPAIDVRRDEAGVWRAAFGVTLY
ncbi:MAG TPA: carboxypeptidase-like regulatory domain-containing protein [Burkholderiales bacterium]|nr:carboxypeptidase-like regulatory domain-containing protein [Burkholderiales bacterium]